MIDREYTQMIESQNATLSQLLAKAKARIAELEDKLSGKSAEVQSKLVEQEVRIEELEKELDDLRQYLHTGEMPKENER